MTKEEILLDELNIEDEFPLDILITGGAGFIGTHLANKLRNDGHKVTLIDNFSTSNPRDGVYKIDLGKKLNMEMIETLVSDAHVCFHFAGSVGVEYLDSNYSRTLMNSYDINNVMFPLFEKYQTRVIYASSSEVYGSRNGKMKETDALQIGSPDQMRWSYACQKLMSEFLIKAYTFPHVIVRFFNVTGAGQLAKYGMVLPKFVSAALSGQDLEVYGDGTARRSFCDVRDAVEALSKLLYYMDGEIINIGAENVISIKELAELVIAETGADVEIKFIPYEQKFSNQHGEIQERTPDITKMKTLHNPEITLEETIQHMIKDYFWK